MTLRFSGTYEQLKTKLATLEGTGQWRDINKNQKQFQHKGGGLLNWYPSTGSLLFQGKQEGQQELEALVSEALSNKGASPGPEPTQSAEVPFAATSDGRTLNISTESAKSSSKIVEPPLAHTNTLQTDKGEQEIRLGQTFSESELVIGLVGSVGTELKRVAEALTERLRVFGYAVGHISVSSDIIASALESKNPNAVQDEFGRITSMMNAGDRMRKDSGDNAILALGVAAMIAAKRSGSKHILKKAYIVNSLKHPEEVERLREIYPQGFYLLGIHADQRRRLQYLVNDKRLTPEQAANLLDRDENEHLEHGQRTSDTFHLSDFFIRLDGNEDKQKDSIWRTLDILFGDPFRTPTFDEFAMFMAFSASLRSADLSRQVGAVVAKDDEILATGANDCPRPGGGLYWPNYNETEKRIVDSKDGRDYIRGQDSNRVEQSRIIDDILKKLGNVANVEKFREALEGTRINDLTEFGRVVHAEMEALLSCARNSVSTRTATLYCTTFPCHNCAKHIIAAGIQRVVYVEPYPKSKAAEFHTDSIELGFGDGSNNLVRFEPFVGIGPRRFFDLFAMRLGSGYRIKRKDKSGATLTWRQETARLRTQMLPLSYMELESVAGKRFMVILDQLRGSR